MFVVPSGKLEADDSIIDLRVPLMALINTKTGDA